MNTILDDRFERHVSPEPNSGCWLWTGSRTHDGYGRFWDGSRTRMAHCFSYEQHVGPVPDGLELDHTCRNRACVNPAHLEPVTHVENCRRGNCAKINVAKTHCPKGHAYEGENLYLDPRGARQCRACRRDSFQRFYQKRKAA